LSKDAYIKLRKRVLPKVMLQIGWLRTINNDLRGYTNYKVIGDQIVATAV
jgi:hypothetical protein